MVFLELTGMKIAILVTLLFGISLLCPILKLIFRFSGKLKEASIFLSLVLVIVITGGILRLFELIPLAYYQQVTIFLSFVITFFIFLTIISLKVMIKNIDYNNHYNLRDNHINFHDSTHSNQVNNSVSNAPTTTKVDDVNQDHDSAPKYVIAPVRRAKRRTIIRHTSARHKKLKPKKSKKSKSKRR